MFHTSSHTPYQQCTRCVMDSTDHEIVFNSLGQCNHCSEFIELKSKRIYQGAKSDAMLTSVIHDMKQKGMKAKYDCVLGISGGADSCYLAVQCKQLGLRVLLVHIDNGWNSELSVKNIERISTVLGFDYISYVLNWDDFRDIQLAHLKASVPEIETPTDIALLEYLHKAAAKHGVKHIIMGGNYVTEGILPKSWHYNAKDKRYSMAIQKQFGTKKPGQFPQFTFLQEIYYKFVKGIRIVYMLNYLPYSKEAAITALENLGWRNYEQKHHESFYTRIVQSYILPLKFNIDYRKPTLSNEICMSKISRDEALKELQRKPYNESSIESDIQYICKKLGITVAEFNVIMQTKAKTHKDYPNNQKFLEFIYKVYSRVFSRTA